jgi:hypothetical protein
MDKPKKKNTLEQQGQVFLSAIKSRMLLEEMSKMSKLPPSVTSPKIEVTSERDPWVSLITTLIVETLAPGINKMQAMPPPISWLKKLQVLSFSNQHFTSIPATIAELVELQELYLNNCHVKSKALFDHSLNFIMLMLFYLYTSPST